MKASFNESMQEAILFYQVFWLCILLEIGVLIRYDDSDFIISNLQDALRSLLVLQVAFVSCGMHASDFVQFTYPLARIKS